MMNSVVLDSEFLHAAECVWIVCQHILDSADIVNNCLWFLLT